MKQLLRTAMEEGDLSGVTLPFFRGTFCVSDEVKPGDTLAVSVAACVHPCLDVNAFAFKWANRCDGDGCEVALALYYSDVVGTACPSDVFGEFDPAACVVTGPHALGIQPPAKEGAGALLLPFLTNADAAAIAGGEEGAAIWTRADAHAQDPTRRIAISYAASNAAASLGICFIEVSFSVRAPVGLVSSASKVLAAAGLQQRHQGLFAPQPEHQRRKQAVKQGGADQPAKDHHRHRVQHLLARCVA